MFRKPLNTSIRKFVTQTHFGFKNVSEDKKSEMVGEVFKRVAGKYDLMNDIMSLGIHRHWKNKFVQKIGPLGGSFRLLDVAGGTGDVAFRFVNAAKLQKAYASRVTILDINEAMLKVGQERAKENGLHWSPILEEWRVGDAEDLPFEDSTFDAYTIAFGIRNCTHIDKVLQEAFRVLKPGGRFLCLELSSGAFSSFPPLFKRIYDQYSFQVVPILGQLFAADRGSYQYLVESIRKFPDQNRFSEMTRKVGFQNDSYENLFGGIAVLHSAYKI